MTACKNLLKMKVLILLSFIHMFMGPAAAGNSFYLVNVENTKCLSPQFLTCQPFTWTSGERLLVPSNGKCLGVQGKTPGSTIGLYDCDENSELQKWECRNSTLIALKGQELFIELNLQSEAVLSRQVTAANHIRIASTSRGACSETFTELYTIGGNANGRPCMFPFLYKDKWYSECTTTDKVNAQAWCSVQTNFDEGLWGYCPTKSRDGWNKHPVTGDYYQINSEATLTWSQAKESCKQQGASLLSITDPHEKTFISGLLSKQGAKLWTGLIFDSEHGWHWSDQKPYRYLDWMYGYPSLTPGRVCGFLESDSLYSWKNGACSMKLGYICHSGSPLQRPTTKPEDDAGFCSSPWIPYNGHCFLLSRNKETWLNAHKECRAKGGDLVSIHNVEEQSFVISQLGYVSGDELWIGLNDRRTRNLFDWSDHSTVSFTNWEYLRPKINNGNQQCVLMRGMRGNWADRPCEEKHGFICMKSSAKQPSGDEKDTNTGCKTGWKRHGWYCYLVGTQTKTFEEAQEHCKSSGSYMADVFNGVDNAFLVSLVGTRPEKYFWLGLSNQKDPETFEWTTTQFVKFTHWNAGMPDNKKGCVAMTTGIFAGLWDVLPCTNKEKFICKHLAEDASLTPAPPTLTPPKCAEGWTRVGKRNFCFKLFPDTTSGSKSWYDAREYCQSIRGDLLSIHSIEELRLLPRTYKNVWIGLSAPDTTTYVWSDGSPVQFKHWVDGQPDNKHNVESCTEVNLFALRNNGSWSDVQCEKNNRWLCQIPAGLTPKTIKPSTPDYNVTSDGWLEWRGNQYYFSEKLQSMEDARHYCKRRHGDLVTINSDVENLFLWNQISSSFTDFYIGLNVDLDKTSQWMDGSLVMFEKWAENQPLFKNYDENCVLMSISTGFWYDSNCGKEFKFICKRSISSPINATVAPTEVPLKGGCPQQWEKLQSKCYRLVDNRMETWEGARTSCKEMGGKLTSILSRHENVFLMSKIASLQKKDYWLGLTSDIGSALYWTDGRAIKYMQLSRWWSMVSYNWYLRWRKGILEKKCFAMTTEVDFKFGSWRRKLCNETSGYICKRDVDPSLPDVPTSYTDYIKLGNNSFKVVPRKLSWMEAKKNCEEDGATLASVLDKLTQIYIDLMTLTFNASLWIGLSRPEGGGNFRYIDGRHLSVVNWDYGEPSSNRPCVYVDVDGRWRASYCNQTNFSVCKKSTDIPPTPPDVHPGVCLDEVWEQSHTAWLPFKGFCYKFVEHRKWWTDASGYCLQYDANLVSILDPEEQKFIESHAKRFEDSFESFWIGLYRTKKGQLIWQDGQVVDYLTLNVSESVKSYGILRTTDGKWDTRDVFDSKPFICKTAKVIPAPPSPTPGPHISQTQFRSRAAAFVLCGLAVVLVAVLIIHQRPQRHLPVMGKLTGFVNPVFLTKAVPQDEKVENTLVILAEE